MHYQLYNLIIRTDILFPELQPTQNSEADLIISEVTDDYFEIVNSSKNGSFYGNYIAYEKSEEALLITIQDVGKFFLNQQNEILFFRFDNVDDNTIRTYILGTCLGFFLIRKGLFAFHGSAVQTTGGIVIFVGDSGVGKSTTAAKFLKEGHKILTDDVCLIEISDDNRLVAYPSLQRIKLWDDSSAALGIEKSTLVQIMPNWEKMQYPVQNHDIIGSREQVLLIYELCPEEREEIEIDNLSGNEKLLTLLKNRYKIEAAPIFDQEKNHFMLTSKIAQNITVKRIKRPLGRFNLDKLYQSIMTDINLTSNVLTIN